jgi:hypothetical protein
MYSVRTQVRLEDKLPPKKLLYLCDGTLDHRAEDIATCLGRILASYPFASPRYGREVAQVWHRYADHANRTRCADRDEELPTRLGEVRMQYAAEIYREMPAVVAPPVPLQHCKRFVRLIQRVSSMVSFSRTGDTFVYKSILSQIPPEQTADMATSEVPYERAGRFFGDSANRRVRAMFEKNVEEEMKTVQWETTTRVEDFILFVMLLFEAGSDLCTTLCCNHEAALLKHRMSVAPFCWNTQLGVLWRNRVLRCNETTMFPIPGLLLQFLELLAIETHEGAASAASMLCAVKTPDKVRAPVPVPVQVPVQVPHQSPSLSDARSWSRSPFLGHANRCLSGTRSTALFTASSGASENTGPEDRSRKIFSRSTRMNRTSDGREHPSSRAAPCTVNDAIELSSSARYTNACWAP